MIEVAVSIDTEADAGDTWRRSAPLAFRSVTVGIADVLTPVFREFGVRPTYLLSSEVLEHDESIGVLSRLRDAELGTHLHGDHVAPGASQAPEGTSSSELACLYPEDVERGKLVTISRIFTDRLGRPPRAYRAGRYGASGRTARLLAELGYEVDASVAPGTVWTSPRQARGRVDFRGAPLAPYRPDANDLRRPGDVAIVEVPITILPRPLWWDAGVMAGQWLSRRPLVRYPVWLRPSTTPWPWLAWTMRNAVRRTMRDGQAWLHVMLHSMEVIAGTSPYSCGPGEAARVVARLCRLLRALRHEGARFHTLSELGALAIARPS
ncbi:MAG: hypothetical protein HY553_11185 [Elusimicrobia bacterium]|nr:hypothetical protein [Elusimicrobiota bacterium]